MHLQPWDMPGVWRVGIDRKSDPRGFFARTFCVTEFGEAGLPTRWVQASISYNERRGTVRGLHFQWPPSREGKLVRCVRGAILDLLLDLRPGSPTYLEHRALQLDEDNREAVLIPEGIAHGFQTLRDRTEVLYQMTDFYVPGLSTGVRWDDPAFGITWPLAEVIVSERDAACPDFDRQGFEAELAARGGGRPSE